MPMLDHRKASANAGGAMCQAWVSDGTDQPIETHVVAVAHLDQAADRCDTDLQAAERLVFQCVFDCRERCLRHDRRAPCSLPNYCWVGPARLGAA